MGNNVNGFDVIPMPAGPAPPGTPASAIDQRCTYQCRQCGASAPARISNHQFRPHTCRQSTRFVSPVNCQQHQLQQQLRNSPIFQQFQQAISSPMMGQATSPGLGGLGGMMRLPGTGGLMNSCSQGSFVGSTPDLSMNMQPFQCMNLNSNGMGNGGMGASPLTRPCMLQPQAPPPMGMMIRPKFMCPQPSAMQLGGTQPTQRFLSPCKSTGAMLNLAHDPAAAQACFNCVRSPTLRPMTLNI